MRYRYVLVRIEGAKLRIFLCVCHGLVLMDTFLDYSDKRKLILLLRYNRQTVLFPLDDTAFEVNDFVTKAGQYFGGIQ